MTSLAADPKPVKGRVPGYVVMILFFLAGIAGFTIMINGGIEQLNTIHVVSIQTPSKWEAVLGDLPVSDGRVQDAKAAWQPYTSLLEQTSSGSPEERTFWIRRTLPEQLAGMRDPQMRVVGVKHYEIYLDNQLIKSYHMNDSEPAGSIVEWNLIPLPPDATGKTMHMRILSESEELSNGQLVVGEGKDWLWQMLRRDAIKLFLTACFLFLFFISVGAYLLYNRDRLYLYFALMTFCAGYASIARSAAVNLFVNVPLFTEYFGLVIPIGAFAFVGIFEQLTDASYQARFRKLRHVLLALAAVGAAVISFDTVWSNYVTVFVYGPTMFTVAFLLAVPVLRRIKQRDSEAEWLIAGIAGLLIGLVLHYSLYFFQNFKTALSSAIPSIAYYWMDATTIMGIFFAVLCLGMVLIARLRSVHDQVQLFSAELQEKNERLLELDRLKDEFLANVSHELRTPLHGMIGLSDSLMEGVAGPINAQMRHNLELIGASGKRLSRLINDLLDLSKLKHQDIAFEPSALQIQDVAARVLAAFEPLAAQKNIRLTCDISGSLPLVSADENRLQQILYNLLGNAVKFTDRGQVRIDAARLDRFVQVRVADTGIGIPRDRLDFIGEPFVQADNRSRRGGTGLGLSISRKLVELHGGQLTIDSEEGIGTSVTFTLPLADESAVQEPAGAEPFETLRKPLAETETAGESLTGNSASAGADDGGRGLPLAAARAEQIGPPPRATILLVDDEPVNLQVLENYLTDLPLDIVRASNGRDALKAIALRKPDLVLLDVMMPDLNGYEVCKDIRQRYDASTLPVILLTAKNRLTDMVEGFEAGANDYIVKPVAKHELLARVDVQLRLSRLTYSLEQMVQERTADLEQTTKRLEESIHETAEALADLSVMEERNRIAQEIHDNVGHTLTTTIVQMEAAKMLLARGDERGMEKLNLSQNLVRQGLDDIRESVRMMKQQGTEFPLESAMMQLMDETAQAAGLDIQYTVKPLPLLTSMQKKVLYHALKEGLTNGMRHGQSSMFHFLLEHNDGRLLFQLWNNGKKYESATPGFGLQTMSERVRQLGGRLFLSSEDEGEEGCLLTIELPVA